MNKIELIERIIHYYELQIDFNKEYHPGENQFRELFAKIINLAKSRAKIRYQSFGEKAIFMQEVIVDPESKLILGKLRCVRKDILPELLNTLTDESRGIEAKEEEGLVETTHFIIDYNKKTKKLAIEYNQFGARISDFVNYVNNIGISIQAVKSINCIPIVKDDLAKYKERINRCSEFVVKIHKDNIEKVNAMDTKLYSALVKSIEHFRTDYATLDLKFDYREKATTKEINNTIFNLITKLVKDKSKTEIFNKLTVRAEDEEKNNRLETFDLLVDKVKSEIKVEKKKRYRTIVSSDIFEKIKKEIIKKRI